jgi:poly(hydroxyalkanoate) granule-associated protein
MTQKKTKSKQKAGSSKSAAVGSELEHVFLAGLGALSNAKEFGSKTFDALVETGEVFREKTTQKTQELIDEVQGAIRGMTDDTEAKASGLIEHIRDASQLDKLYSVFDSRVADAIQRLGVPTKRDLDKLSRKLDKVLAAVDGKKPPAKRKAPAATKRKVKKKVKKKAKKKATGKTG